MAWTGRRFISTGKYIPPREIDTGSQGFLPSGDLSRPYDRNLRFPEKHLSKSERYRQFEAGRVKPCFTYSRSTGRFRLMQEKREHAVFPADTFMARTEQPLPAGSKNIGRDRGGGRSN